MSKDNGTEIPPPQSIVKPSPALTREALGVAEGKVVVRKVRGAEGTHPVVGHCEIGDLNTVRLERAIEMVEGGEFEAVTREDKNAVGQAMERRANAKMKIPG